MWHSSAKSGPYSSAATSRHWYVRADLQRDHNRAGNRHRLQSMARTSMRPEVLLFCSAFLCSLGAHAGGAKQACNLAIAPPEARLLYQNRHSQVVVLPTELPAGFSGCQRTWIAYENSREHSVPMTDSFFIAGKPVRVMSYFAGETVRDCRYVGGNLDTANSLKPATCPSASMLSDAAKEGAFTPPFIER